MAGVVDPAAVWRHADNARSRAARPDRSSFWVPRPRNRSCSTAWPSRSGISSPRPPTTSRVAEQLAPDFATEGTDIRDVVISTRQALVHVGAIVEA